MSRLSDDLGIYEINERWHSTQIRDGICLTENESPVLDSLTVIIDNESALDIHKNDIVGLNDNINEEDVYFIVATFDEEKAVDITGEAKYKYTLNLVSPTKLFETISLSNVSNTNIGNDLTIDEFLRPTLEYYLSWQFDGLDDKNQIIIAIDYPYNLGYRVCPEFTLGEPTLRELINYLWAIKNCTFVGKIINTGLRYAYVISYLDYNKRGNQIYTSDMIIERTDSIENNASHLKSNLGNVIDTKVVTELAVFKSDSYIYQTSDFKVILNHPIYEIYAFKILLILRKYYKETVGDSGYLSSNYVDFSAELDATDFIFEKKIYDTLNIMKPAGSASSTASWTYPNKNTACFYERETNVIDGLLEPTKGWGNFTTEYAIEYIISKATVTNTTIIAFSGAGSSAGVDWDTPPSGYYWCDEYDYLDGLPFVLQTDVKDSIFKIQYKTSDPQLAVVVEQTVPIDERRTYITNNQGDSVVNLDKFISGSLEKVNQMGNDTKPFVGLTTNLSRLPKIGDYDGDYTVTNMQYQITNGVYEYKGVLSKYFVNTALYTSLERQKRYTALQSVDEAIQRDEVIILHSNIFLSSYSVSGLPNYSIKSNVCKCRLGLSRANDYGNTSPSTTLLIPAKTKNTGNMIIYSMSFSDNVVAGRRKGQSVITGTSTYPMTDVLYVNSDGEFKGAYCEWFEDYTLKQYTNRANIFEALNVIPNTYGLEVVTGDENGAYNKLFTSYFKFIKDNREKISLTTEIVFKSNNSKVVVGNNFARIFSDGCFVTSRDREFTTLDQIVNTDECILILTQLEAKSMLVNNNYNSFRIANINSNIAFVASGGDLLLAINNYKGEYICFGAPSSTDTSGYINYVLLDFKSPVLTQSGYNYTIANRNSISVTYYWYYVLEDDTEVILDSGTGTLSANSSISVTPDRTEGTGILKVKFSNNDLQETNYVYSN